MSNFHNQCLFFGATEIRILIHSIVQYGHNRNGLMYIKCIGAGIYASEYSLVWQEGHSRPPSISWPRALCEDQKQNSRTSQNFDNLGLAQNTRLIFNLTEIVASDFVQRFTQLVVVLSWSCERHLLMLWLSKCCRSCLGNKKNGNGSWGIICASIVSLSLSPLSQKTVSLWNFKPWGGEGKGIFAEIAKQDLISRAWGIKVVALLLGQLVTHIVDKKGEKYGQELILVLRQKLPPRKVWPKTNSHGDEGRRQLAPQL